MPRRCPRCHAVEDVNHARFCSRCGGQLVALDPDEELNEPDPIALHPVPARNPVHFDPEGRLFSLPLLLFAAAIGAGACLASRGYFRTGLIVLVLAIPALLWTARRNLRRHG